MVTLKNLTRFCLPIFSITLAADAAILTLTGAYDPNALVTEPGNSGTNDSLLTTIKDSGTSWDASGGVIKLITGSANREVWIGTSNNFFGDDSAFQLSDTLTGNSLSLTARLVPGSSSWQASFYDDDGYQAALYFDYTEGDSDQPGVWAQMEGEKIRLTPEGFDTSKDDPEYYTYTSHVYDGTVAYFIDGELAATGLAAKTSNTRSYGLTVIGDRSENLGVGEFWIDKLVLDNAAGAFDEGLGGIGLIPEPATLPVFFGLALFAAGGLRRRRR